MPARYYTKAFEDKGITIRIVWIDTAPMMDKYRNDSATYPDACKQDLLEVMNVPADIHVYFVLTEYRIESLLHIQAFAVVWIDSVLANAKEDWIIVAGHHPIYAETPKDDSERLDMQKRLDPILRKHKVDMYICGTFITSSTYPQGGKQYRLRCQLSRFACPQGETDRRNRILQS